MSDKIDIGEYIRTEGGYILENTIKAHKNIIEKLVEEDREYKNKFGKITKHGKDIIDLIEVGDYVNGYKVSDKESTLLSTNVHGIDRSGYHIPISQYGEGIKTILTHEKYEQNCYEVGGNIKCLMQ